jgi:flagellar hook-associated protein 2
VLTATASAGAAVGSFQFQVARLVTTQQSVSNGFTDVTSTKVGAGTLTIEMGGGEVNAQTLLSQLRGGTGIRRGLFRITDGSGKSAVIDITSAVTLDDVLKKINTSLDVSVKATVSGDTIKLTDLSGQTTTPFTVTDLADGHAAEDLGFANVAAVAGVITGGDINYLGRNTTLNSINDGRGIRRGSSGNDLAITAGGTTYNISLTTAKTIGDVMDAISTGTSGNVTVTLDPATNGLVLSGAALTVADFGDSRAATDLGIVGSGATVAGGAVLAGLNTILISSLNGGQGFTLGTIKVTNAAGVSADVDLSGARTVQQVLDAITNAGINVKGALNQSGNGIQVIDNSGGAGLLKVEESGGGNTAATLGLLATAAAGTNFVSGTNLQRQWVSENTLLKDYNGGKGVSPGKFKISNSMGNTITVDLTKGNKFTLGDIIRDINGRSMGVTASISAHGDGLLLTDTAGGGAKLKVENVDGTSATDLGILGTATATTIDGSFEKTITVAATDTLTTIQQKFNDLNFGVQAQVISDGSSIAPFRLSLSAKNTGRDGRVVFDGGTTRLGTRNLVEAQDAAVFIGSADSAEPMLITAGSNQLSGIVKGVNIDLHGVSNGPVTLNVTRNVDKVIEDAKKFADDFNGLVDKVKELTAFDPDTQKGGLLLGDATVRQVEAVTYSMLQTVVGSGGKYRILSDVGLKVGGDSKLEFDEDKFRAAYADDPDGVANLFTAGQQALGVETPSSKLNNGNGLRTLDGANDDFKITLRDGTNLNINLGSPATLKDALDVINAASPAKLKAELRDDGRGLRLTDLTGATAATLKVTALNGSQAAIDLGLNANSQGNFIDGINIISAQNANVNTGGVGAAIEKAMNKLIDPVDGLIPRENKTIDSRTQQFQDRMDQLDKLLEQKRARLERQFANMETVLANLQSQQQALGSLTTISQPAAAKKSA